MKKILSAFLILVLAFTLVGCDDVITDRNGKIKKLSVKEAKKEVNAFYREISPKKGKQVLDIDEDTSGNTNALAKIDTFKTPVVGSGELNIEIAGDTEMTSDAPDNWLNIMAEKYNNENHTINGKKVTITTRQITGGESYTYMTEGNYKPDALIPSNEIVGKMIEAKGIGIEMLEKRILGGTAGILMKKDVYNKFKKKYKEVDLVNIIKAANAKDLVFGYTNPYTSSTGINVLSNMLYNFDNSNPLSEKATQELINYQKNAPTAAYSTAVMAKSASKGIIDAMTMEAQAYVNDSSLKDYVYSPVGERHDHPLYTFDYVSADKKEAIKDIAKYLLSKEAQDKATTLGFNQYNEYTGSNTNLTGNDYIAIQKIWKKNKNGNKPIIAVFVTDVSGSMKGERLNNLKTTLLKTSQYINQDNYIGLVSYSDDVTINLPIKQFDNTQRAYFNGSVKNLNSDGGTATYDATLVATKMLLDKQKEVPDADLLLFVLTDGEQNEGYSVNRIAPIVAGLNIPVFGIGYDCSETNGLDMLSDLNEGAFINTNTENIIKEVRKLFEVNM